MKNKILKNIFWLSGEKILRLSVNLFIGAWTARYLKPEQYGIINYAIAFVGLFSPLANSNDLNSIVIRELSIQTRQKNLILGSALLLRFTGSVIAFILSLFFICTFMPENGLFQLIILLISSSSSIFYTISTIDCWFQYNVESKYSVIAKNSTFLATTLIKIYLIIFKYPLLHFVYLIAFEYILSSILLIIAYRLNGQYLSKWKSNFKMVKRIFKDCWVLVLSSLAASIYLRIDQTMLGQMTNSGIVGIYSVAVRFSDIYCFIPASITASVLPHLIETKTKDNNAFYKKLQEIFDISLLTSIPIVLAAMIGASTVVRLIYGEDYLASANVITIHIWSVVFVSLGIAKSLWIIAENHGFYSLVSAFSGALINIILNFLLIPKYSATGAAVATLISYVFVDYLTCFLYPKAYKIGWMLTKSITLISPISLTITYSRNLFK